MIKETVQKKGKSLTLILGLLLIFCLGAMVYFVREMRLLDALKPVCEINKAEDVFTCWEKNHYVTVNFEQVYTTNYAYFKGTEEVAEYLDLDLEGYSLVSLVNQNQITGLFEDKTTTALTGKLTMFTSNDIHKDILGKIQADYIEEFQKETDISEEQVLSSFLPYQLNQYQGSKADDYVLLGVIVLALLFLLVGIFRGLRMIFSPEKTKMLKDHEEEISNIEYEIEHSQKYTYKKKIVTEHYVIDSRAFSFKVYRIDQIAWIYFYIQKRNGIEVSRYYVAKLKNGKQFALPNKEELVQAIATLNPSILLGYSKENQEAYKKLRNLK